MSWDTVKVASDRLAALLAGIRSAGGTVTSCRPQADGVFVTWTMPTDETSASDAPLARWQAAGSRSAG